MLVLGGVVDALLPLLPPIVLVLLPLCTPHAEVPTSSVAVVSANTITTIIIIIISYSHGLNDVKQNHRSRLT
jgi:hypothetical protein